MVYQKLTPDLKSLKNDIYGMIQELTRVKSGRKSIPFRSHGRRYTIVIVPLKSDYVISNKKHSTAFIAKAKKKIAEETKKYTPDVEDVQSCFTCHGPTFGGVCLTRGCPLASPPNPQ